MWDNHEVAKMAGLKVVEMVVMMAELMEEKKVVEMVVKMDYR